MTNASTISGEAVPGESVVGAGAAPGMVRIVLRALGVAMLAIVVVALAALVLAGAQWTGVRPSVEWSGDRFEVASGSAIARGGALVVQAPDPNGSFIAVRPNVGFDAKDYVAVDIELVGLTEAQPVAVFWRTRLSSGRTFNHQADVVTRGGVRARVDRNPNWNGPIYGLGVVVVGSPPRGAAIVRVRLISASAGAQALETARSWLGVEPWTNQSINVVFLGGQYQALPMTLFAGLAAMLAIAGWIGWNYRKGVRSIALGVLVIAGAFWLALDLRWLANFALVERQTTATFAGKSWRDARMAADDGALFAFIEQARARIAERPGRVFFSSDDAWLRVRGGYHLLPFNTLAIPYHRNLFAPERYRPGDWISFYLRGGVAYDAGAQALSWDGLRPVKAERVFADNLGALYRVLP